jgi:hypothetical protein
MEAMIEKFSGLIYGEGRKDKIFLIALLGSKKFRHHTKNWFFQFDNSHGCSPKDILENCKRSMFAKDYDIVLCFIDLDKLKNDFPNHWQKVKKELEVKYLNIEIIWFLDNLEDEISKVLEITNIGKSQVNRMAKENIDGFINSDLWKRILSPIRKKENI